ncbi:MAG: radical SAM protein [Verrucomicrobiota bacterium]|jgi:Radical SAM superfamily
MLIIPHTLSLITTYRCTAACDHCCFGCSPQAPEGIPASRMRSYIEQAAEIHSVKVVVFTGGECFLLGRELDELVKTAADHKFVTRFVSNGYWATSLPAARRRLKTLHECGLREANFSTGEQHARYIRPEYVRNGAIAAAELGMASLVAVDAFGDSVFDFDAFIDNAEFQKHVDAGTIVLKVSPWMRFRGERRLAYTKQYLQKMEQHRSFGVGCATLLKVLAVNPAEELGICCGLTLEQIPEMKIGSLREHSIRELLVKTPDDFVKIWIYLQGPDAVLRYARQLDPSISIPRQQAHTCEVCRYVYGNPRIREAVMRQPPENMRDLITQYVQGLAMPLGEVDSKFAARVVRGGGDVKQLKQLHRETRFKCQCV